MTEIAGWQERLPYMEGNATMARGASYFKVPMWSRIKGDLWMGCSPAEFPDGFDPDDMHTWNRRFEQPYQCKWLWKSEVVGAGPGRFDAILNLYVYDDTKYIVPLGTEYEEFTMSDGDEVLDSEVNRLAGTVVAWLMAGKKTLVHCQAGLNRSSLIVARTLMLGQDMTAKDAIALIREKRSPMCLCNDTFRIYLERLDG